MTSTMRSLQNYSSSLEQLWSSLGRLLRSGWTVLLSDELLRNYYLGLYNDAADPTRRPLPPPGESSLNEPTFGIPVLSVLVSFHS